MILILIKGNRVLKSIFVLVLLLFITNITYSNNKLTKNDRENITKARGHFTFGEYFDAEKYYSKVNKSKLDNKRLNYEIGVTLLHLSRLEESLVLLLRAEEQGYKIHSRDSYRLRHDVFLNEYYADDLTFLIARNFHLLNDFARAFEYYSRYKDEFLAAKKKNIDSDGIKYILTFMDQVVSGIQLVKKYDKSLEVMSIGEPINTRYDEVTPVIDPQKNVLAITARKKGSTGGKIDEDGAHMEDIYFCKANSDTSWGVPMREIGYLNTKFHDAICNISWDGNRLYLYRSDLSGVGNLYMSHFEENKWRDAEKLPRQINAISFETSISSTPDNRTFYFSSNRSGGFGGLDIYKVIKSDEDGSWSDVFNLGGAINTEYDEDSPFISPDRKRLYFSSKGHNTMGGYDVFYSELEEGDKWGAAQNLGYPINTAQHESHFNFALAGDIAYFTSQRTGDQGAFDIYKANFINVPAFIVHGDVVSKQSGLPLSAQVDILDDKGEIVVKTTSLKNDKGDFAGALFKNGHYTLKVKSDGFDELILDFDITINPIYHLYQKIELFASEKAELIVLESVQFDNNKYELKEEGLKELMIHIDSLLANTEYDIEIIGHTDFGGNESSNRTLSLNRADAVRDFFIENGIKKNRITTVGYGAKYLLSKEEEFREKNRRIEIAMHNTDIVGKNWKPRYEQTEGVK